MQVTLVLLRCLRPHLCLSSLFSISLMSCLTHHVRSRDEATHPRLPASLCEVLRSLLHLLGLRLFRGAGTVSRDTPILLLLSRF